MPSSSPAEPCEDFVISVTQASKTYRIYDRPQDRLLQSFYRHRRTLFREHEALKPTSLHVRPGETVGVVGSNGSGKSTLLQLICGTLTPSSGHVQVRGRVSALLELGAGFNPEFSGRENVFLNASILGLSQAETVEKYSGIVQFSGLSPELLERPVKTYSSGMYVRLAFAVAVAVEPDILIVDEALAVGDEAFQRKCYAHIRGLQERGTAILFVSHASQTIIDLCTRALLLDRGEMLMEAAPREVIAEYHKLIYAPVAEQEELRRRLLARTAQEEAPAPAAAITEAPPPPESMVAYAKNGGEILAPQLVDEHGARAQHLVHGARYHLLYRLRAERDLHPLRLAMFIKTKTGLELAGTLLHAARHQLPAGLRAGEEAELRFSFPCLLRPGVYYVNCGVTTLVEEEEVFVHRLVDALEFRVLPEFSLREDMEPRGIVDLEILGSARVVR
jgi:lipopolysaccharide transport system ATP-binding protein